MTSIIKCKNLTKKYGKHIILDQFNLTVEQGEMIAITGKSGCGKSTLLNILGLIEPFDEGTVTILGKENIKPVSHEAILMIRHHINYLFQNFALVDNETVKQNLMYALQYTKMKKADKEKVIETALDKVSLKELMNQKVATLSGGQQQRVAVARIILKPCDIILADEPTGSLDEENSQLIMNLLKSLHTLGKTIVIVTHDMRIASQTERIIEIGKNS